MTPPFDECAEEVQGQELVQRGVHGARGKAIRSVGETWLLAVAAAEIKDVRPHDLRRWAITPVDLGRHPARHRHGGVRPRAERRARHVRQLQRRAARGRVRTGGLTTTA